MNITLFGGSFNPPHLGHEIVMAQAFDLIPDLEQIWLLPDYQHSFTKNLSLAPVQHRLNMAKMLENHRIHTQTCNIDQKMTGDTINHITYLKKTYPQHNFSFLLGSDNLKTFNLWPQWQTLLTLLPFYVYPRAGFPFKPIYPHMNPLIHPLQVITNISSTIVRRRLQANLTINHLVPVKVAEYIQAHRLFLLPLPKH